MFLLTLSVPRVASLPFPAHAHMNPVLLLILYAAVMLSLSLLFMQLSWRTRSRREQREYEEFKREHPERVFGTNEYIQRFDHPDFAVLETHLGRSLPAIMKTFYADDPAVRKETEIVVPAALEGLAESRLTLNFFPADQLAIDDLWPIDDLDRNQIPFAADNSGGMYFLELQAEDEQNPPVYVVNFDDGLCRRISDSLTQFLSWRQ